MSEVDYQFEVHPDLPAVILTMSETFSMATSYARSTEEFLNMFDSLPRPYYYIVDVNKLKWTLQDIIQATNSGARGDTPPLQHPNLIELIVVTESRIYELASKGMNSAVFNFIPVQIHKTIDAALAYIAQQESQHV